MAISSVIWPDLDPQGVIRGSGSSVKPVSQYRIWVVLGCEVADIWLRKAARVDARAIKALSFPNKSEETRIGKLVRMAGVI